MIRDALIREVTFGDTTCPTEEVCRLMASFLQRLPSPRLVHFLDMILPQMVPHDIEKKNLDSSRREARCHGRYPSEHDVGTQSQPRREESVEGGRGRSGVLFPVDVNEVERRLAAIAAFPKP